MSALCSADKLNCAFRISYTLHNNCWSCIFSGNWPQKDSEVFFSVMNYHEFGLQEWNSVQLIHPSTKPITAVTRHEVGYSENRSIQFSSVKSFCLSTLDFGKHAVCRVGKLATSLAF